MCLLNSVIRSVDVTPREELLDFYWNQMETLESDNSAFLYVSWQDLQKLEDLFVAWAGDPV